MLKGLKKKKNVERSADRVGGGSKAQETDLYRLKIVSAYLSDAKSGATMTNIKGVLSS